jgi:hypothetical protein
MGPNKLLALRGPRKMNVILSRVRLRTPSEESRSFTAFRMTDIKGSTSQENTKMNNKTFAAMISLLTLLGLTLAACSSVASVTPTGSSASKDLPSAASTVNPTQETYSDPFAYCAAVGQIDAPDSRYSGPKMPDSLFKDYLLAEGLDPNTSYPDTFKQMTIWRCMDKKVYVCNFGANIPCDSKANTDKNPTQAMIDYCKQNPDVDFIPMSVTGHNVIYSWHCVKDTPEILDQIDTVDAAGYGTNFWKRIEPNP